MGNFMWGDCLWPRKPHLGRTRLASTGSVAYYGDHRMEHTVGYTEQRRLEKPAYIVA